ncbi:MAG: hypothetical protein B7Z61_14075 [Acidobacteria bacterium 37-71-11]|nr:MAG: hypothetical protein B7Z61_14075 [Acidobacteria bacterium 37-71-11]
MIRSYRDLQAWQKAMDFAVEAYQLAKKLPTEERYGLASQLQRAASSVPANIAEGHGRIHRADYVRFLSVARGSLMETETHLELAVRLGFLRQEETEKAAALSREAGRILNGLISALRKPPGGP